MAYKIRFIIIICLFLFKGCDRETELEIPYSGDKMVIYSFLSTDQPIKVRLSKSRPLDSGLVTYIKDATIKLYENNIHIEDLICNYDYVSPSNFMCKGGTEYTLYIYHKKLGTSKASTEIPTPTPIKVVDTSSMNKLYTWRSLDVHRGREEIFLLSGLRSVLEIKIEINDPPGEKNYYILDVDGPPFEAEIPEPGIYSIPFSYDSEEEMIDGWIVNRNVSPYVTWVYSAYFSDRFFNGKNFIFTIYVLKEYVINSRIHIKLYTINEEYYNYIKSVQEWEENKDNPFSEPVIIYSNVVNGMGILGGASCYTDSTVVIQ